MTEKHVLYSAFSCCEDLLSLLLSEVSLPESEGCRQDNGVRGDLSFYFWTVTYLGIRNQVGLEEWIGEEMNFSSSGWWRKWGLLRGRWHWGREWQWRWGKGWRSWWRFSQSADECSQSTECIGMFWVSTLVLGGLGQWKIIEPLHLIWAYVVITLAVIFVWHLMQEVRIVKESSANKSLFLLFIVSVPRVLLLA